MSSGPEPSRPLTRPCPRCETRCGRRLGDLRFQVFDDSPVAGAFSMVVCEHCGAAFYDTPSRQADYDRYYQGNAYYYTSEKCGSGGSTPADKQRFAALARRLTPYIPRPDAAIFDVGCAKGGLLAVLAEHGHERLYGVDMLPSCIDYVRNVRGLAAAIGSALALPFPEVLADVLIYSHIVEHVIDLQAMMAAAREKLSEDGIVYVEVPDASRYGEGSAYPYQDLYLEHVNHFDRAALVSQFQAGGFSLVSTGETLLEAPPHGRVPCLWGIFRKGGGAEERTGRSLEGRLRDYLAWSEQHPAMEIFAQLAREQTPLHVWGISQYAMLLLGQTDLRHCALQGFVDKDPYKQQRTLGGKPIRPPEVLRDIGPPHAVLITAPGYEDQIAAGLQEMGFRGTILTTAGEAGQSGNVHHAKLITTAERMDQEPKEETFAPR